MPDHALHRRFSEGSINAEHLNTEFDLFSFLLNGVSLVNTLANRTSTPLFDHAIFHASDTLQSFFASAGAWQAMGPRRGTATIPNGTTTVSVSLSPAEPDTNYGVYATFGYDQGGGWITGTATNEFTVNVATAATGDNGAIRWIVVRD